MTNSYRGQCHDFREVTDGQCEFNLRFWIPPDGPGLTRPRIRVQVKVGTVPEGKYRR